MASGHSVTGSCPKHMVMGPCGGVRADGRCEVVSDPCVFPAPAEWAEPVPAVPLRAVPLILTDFSSESYSVRMLKMVARTLAPSCDAVLVGEHQDRPDFPPTLLASMLQEAGVRPWMTLACRDRNRIVLEEELTGLRHLGVDAVLCVTGDARAYDVRPDVTQVFDLDGPRLAALAASIGISAAVPETPAAPPRHLRAVRLAQKQRAGAAAAVLNHDTVASVTAFMSGAAALPFADGAVGLAWSLGVLCTAPGREAQLAMLLEMRRVVRPGGRIGLLVYLATTGVLDDPPQGNHFPTSTGLHTLLRRADLDVLAVADSQDMPEPPASWQQRTAAVERELQRRFGHTPQLAAAAGQSHRIGHLLEVGQLTSQVLLLARE